MNLNMFLNGAMIQLVTFDLQCIHYTALIFDPTNVSYAPGAHCLLCSSNHLHQMFNYSIIPIFVFRAQQTHILLPL